ARKRPRSCDHPLRGLSEFPKGQQSFDERVPRTGLGRDSNGELELQVVFPQHAAADSTVQNRLLREFSSRTHPWRSTAGPENVHKTFRLLPTRSDIRAGTSTDFAAKRELRKILPCSQTCVSEKKTARYRSTRSTIARRLFERGFFYRV